MRERLQLFGSSSGLKGGLFTLLAAMLLSISAKAQTAIAVGPQSSTFSSMVRGYYFTAPVNFTICGLYIPTDASTASQNVEVVRFNAGAPPAYPGTTNNFVSLFYQNNYAPNTMIPCNIPVTAGDVIGVYGARGSGQVNSYDGVQYATTILGNPVTLYRSGMQNNLSTMQMNNIWSEINASIGRVIMYVNCCAAPTGPGTLAGNANVCEGSTQTYSVSGVSGATNYNWTVPSGSVITSGQGTSTITVTVGPTSGNVCVTPSNSCTSIANICQALNVTPLPAASAGPDVVICQNDSVTLSASGGTSYSWSPSTGLSNSAISNPSASPPSTTTYTLTVSNNGCVNTDTITVLVNSLPIVSAGSDATLCGGDSITLNASGGLMYSWSPSAGLSDSTIANPVAVPLSTTNYIVTATDGNGCMNSDTVMITVSAPSVTVSSNTAICTGDSVQITATSATATSYSWGPATGLDNSAISSPMASPSASTTYTITATDASGCIAVDSVLIAVNALPVANAGTDVAVCAGSGVLLSASGGSTYSWSPSAGLNNTNTSSPFASPAATTDYVVTVTDANGCSQNDTVTVTVNPLPVANAGTDVSICSGSSAVLSASGGVSYSWGPSTGLSSTTINNPVADPTTTTSYTVTVTDANGCVNADVVVVTVNPQPVANAGPDAAICNGSSTTLNASGGTSYSWSPTTGLSVPPGPNPVASPTVTTSYTVTVSNSAGCSSTDVVVVTVNDVPVMATPSITDALCGNTDGAIAAGALSGGTGPFMYSLNGGPVQISDTFTGLAPGSYTIMVTDANGCSSSQPAMVNQVLGVNVAVSATPLSGFAPLDVAFVNSTTGANAYSWDFGDNSATSNASAPSHTYNEAGTYTVVFTAWNNDPSCSASDTITIIVEDDVFVEIPNVFTPNGDGKNDHFKLNAKGVSSIEGTIFNRWGNSIATWGGDPNTAMWDGKGKSGMVDDGVYYYVIRVMGKDNKVYEYNGYVHVLTQ